MAGYLIILALFLLVIVFAVQNAGVVALSFIFWKFQASLSILIVLFFIAGAASTILVYLITKMRRRAHKKGPEYAGDIPLIKKAGGKTNVSGGK